MDYRLIITIVFTLLVLALQFKTRTIAEDVYLALISILSSYGIFTWIPPDDLAPSTCITIFVLSVIAITITFAGIASSLYGLCSRIKLPKIR